MTRILIADDNPQNLYLLESILKGYKFDVITTRNGAEALDIAIKNPPDLIIADILMPVMDGFELCRKWKADERLQYIPFVFYTATYIDANDERFAQSLGAERFIIKPQKPEILGQIVRQVLEESRQKTSPTPQKPLGDEMEVLRQYNEVLFRKLEKKVMQLETEISERKRAEEGLRASENFLDNIVERIPDMIFVKDAKDLRFVRINKAGEDLLEYSRIDLLGKTDYDLFPKPEADLFTGNDREALGAGQFTDIPQETIKTRYRGERILHTKKIPILDESGNPRYLLGISEDITDRKNAENALKESTKRLQEAQEMAHLGFWLWDVKTGYVEWSDEVFRIFGLDPKEFIPHIESILALSPWPDEQQRDRELIRRATESREPGMYEQRFFRPDKSIGYYHSTFEGRYDERGNLVSIVGTVLDITERKRAEEKLLQSEARYRKLYESMMDAFIQVNMAGQIQEFNQSFREMVGYSDEELVRLTYRDLTPEKWHAFEDYIIESQIIPREYSDVYEKEYRKKDGTVFPVELRLSLIRDEAGLPAGMWAIVRDITERKRAEERIRLANCKLALMNDVTYQDIQNKVTGLRGYVELSKKPESEHDRLIFIEREMEILASIHDLIQHTKDYQQVGVDKSRWIHLEQTIRAQLSLISEKHNVSLEIDLRGLEIYADPMIDRVFYNLVVNAIQHGKTLTRISFKCQETRDGMVLVGEDDGIGISQNQKLHIFDRIVGGGGKFGLFFVREFLTTSGMTISETGTPGKGARFEIAIPKGLYRFA